ncbi:6987_t:CDS:2 [Ambispora leptoticha]|uniref:6987_t:CDS:1 n=1 Tax=Ambispora leptoticha TaxID=144679 RepID=A0A9N9EYZ4_9GLOM|nr:6987_t:CDS:2 [Ambispora leptoticha]
MGKSAKFYKRQTRKERKIQSLTAEALGSSSSLPKSSSIAITTKFKKTSSKKSTFTSSSSSKIKANSIKTHRDELLKSILKGSEVKSQDKITTKNNHDDSVKQDQMDVDDNKGGKKKKERRKTNEGRPDYVDIFGGKKTFKKI